MTHILIVLAAILLVVPRSWGEEPSTAPGAVTTTTAPGDRGYHPHPSDPSGLPTGLPGFGSPGAKPSADEQKVKVVPRPTADTP